MSYDFKRNYNSKLEYVVLAKVIQNGGSFADADGFLEPLSFIGGDEKVVWRTFEHLSDSNVEITSFTVKNHLERTGHLDSISLGGQIGAKAIDDMASYDGDSIKTTPLANFSKQLQEVVATRDIYGYLVIAQQQIEAGESPDSVLSYLEMESGRVALSGDGSSSQIKDSKTVAKEISEEYIHAKKYGSMYIETGLWAFDNFMGGLYPSRVYMIVGTSGDGKSLLMQNMLYNISFEGVLTRVGDDWVKKIRKSGLITMEQQNREVGKRFVQMGTGLIPMDIEKGNLTKEQEKKFEKELIRFSEAPMIWDESPSLTMPQCRYKIRQMAAQGAEVIVIDQMTQLQLVGSERRYDDTDAKGYILKDYGREFNVPILTSHQLKKSTNDVHRKGVRNISLSDVNESGEKGVDGVSAVRHDKEGNYMIHLKARQGGAGSVARMDFDFFHTRYSNHSNPEDLPDEMLPEDNS